MASGGDVTVRGGGIFGLSCAWALVRRGARVRLIEAERIGAGASGGVVGALAPHTPERWTPLKQFQLDSLLAAEGFWAEVADVSGRSPGYARTGRLQPIADEAALTRAVERSEAAAALWKGRAEWRVIGRDEVGDWAPESATGQFVADTLSARINPAEACAALAAGLRALGVEIVEGADAPDRGAVIWATGAAGLAALSGALSGAGGREVGRGVKGQAALVALSRPDAPQLYADGLHIVPHADGTTAIGSTTERDYDAPDRTDAQLDDVIARARSVVPALRDAPVIRRWAGLRPRARSRAPMLGAWPERPGHFIANGGFKIGFGLAPGVAEVMADLVLNEQDSVPDGCRVADSL